MTRRRWFWLTTVALLALVAAVAAPNTGATQRPPKSAKEPAKIEPEKKTDSTKEPDDSTVEQILRQQEALITGGRFEYDPGNRRDPFRSLLEDLKPGGRRGLGVKGMLVAEIDIVGVIRDAKQGDLAMVSGSDAKGYFLRVGDEVYDGMVIGIDPRQGTVTFRQKVEDPRIIKPYRDVVKRLVPAQPDEEPSEDKGEGTDGEHEESGNE
jgi:hypothetical protein